jgi:hypothetical protein
MPPTLVLGLQLRRLGPGAVLLLLVLLLALAGCAANRPPAQTPSAAAPAASGAPVPVWQVPADAYGTQTLYRVMVSGAEGEGSVRLTLRLAAPDRYQAQAADPLGRALWSLDVENDHGWWLDHRNRTFCRLAGPVDLAVLPLGPLAPAALPPLLLGRLPVPPAAAESVTRQSLAGGAGEDLSFHDAAGRRWGAVVRDGRVLSWTLWQEGAVGPVLSWVADTGRGDGTGTGDRSGAGWAKLTDRRKGVEVRWRQVLREPLRQALDPLTRPGTPAAGASSAGSPGPSAALVPAVPPVPPVPSDYRERPCGRAGPL